MIEEAIFGDQYSKSSSSNITGRFEELKLLEFISEDAKESIWKFEDPHSRLMSRNKWSHLTYDEQLHVYREHAFQHKSISWIWKEYGLSSSAVKHIIKMFKLNVDRSEIYTNVRCRGFIKRQLVQNIIKRFIDRQ